MKIAATYDNGNIFQHFGKTEFFKVYEVEDNKVVSSEVISSNGTGHGALAGLLADQGISVLICGGIGGGAQTALAEAGVELCSGAQGDADQAVEAYLKGELVSRGATCDHHHHEEGCNCHEHHHEHEGGCSCHEHHHHHHADEVFTSWGKETIHTYTKDEVSAILKTLEEDGSYGNVLRAKGMVAGADGEWIYFDMVPEEYEVRTGTPQITGKICVIVSKMAEDKIAEIFGVNE